MSERNMWDVLFLEEIDVENSCIPAALDCVSQKHDIPVEVYRRYSDFVSKHFREAHNNEEEIKAVDEVLAEVGTGTHEWKLLRITNSEKFSDLLEEAKVQNERVLIYTTPVKELPHVIGLRYETGEQEGWRTVGFVPIEVFPLDPRTDDQPIRTADEIYPNLQQNFSVNGKKGANVIILPPETV